MSFLVQVFLNFSKYPTGGTNTPVDPATGSTITAAIFSLPWKLTISSKASALSFPYFGCPHEKEFFSGICVWGKWITPFNKLPNCALLATIPPTEVPPNPDPWYPLDLPINFYFVPIPLELKYANAILRAVSTASEPELVKKTLSIFLGKIEVSFSANSKDSLCPIWKDKP